MNGHKPVILAVSPHSDDLALSLGGFLMQNSGHASIHAVTVFSGSDWVHPSKAGKIADVSNRRDDEDRSYFNSMGIQWQSVGIDDAMRRGIDVEKLTDADHNLQSPAAQAVLLRAASALQTMIETIKPDIVLAPGGVGAHLDHLITCTAAVNAVTSASPAPILLYYEELPYAYRWARTTMDINAQKHGAEGGGYYLPFSMSVMVKKTLLLRHYKSQFPFSSLIGFFLRTVLANRGFRRWAENFFLHQNAPHASVMLGLLGLKPRNK